jgi:hypothetical protein
MFSANENVGGRKRDHEMLGDGLSSASKSPKTDAILHINDGTTSFLHGTEYDTKSDAGSSDGEVQALGASVQIPARSRKRHKVWEYVVVNKHLSHQHTVKYTLVFIVFIGGSSQSKAYSMQILS